MRTLKSVCVKLSDFLIQSRDETVSHDVQIQSYPHELNRKVILNKSTDNLCDHIYNNQKAQSRLNKQERLLAPEMMVTIAKE